MQARLAPTAPFRSVTLGSLSGLSLLALLLAMVGAGCGYSEEEMQAKITQIDDLQTQLREARGREQELQTRLGELEQQNGQLANRLRALGEEAGELRGNLTQTRASLNETQANLNETQASLEETQRALAELRERERQQQARLATFRQMLARFRAMIDSGRLRVRIVRNRMVIELSNNILFDSGRAELKTEGESALGEIATVLASIQNREFQVCGHTDNIPMRSSRFDSNWHLSTARAVTVTRFLASRGVPANRVSAAGFADTQPVATNDTEEGRAQNRRIEIVLLPNLDELPDLSSLAGSN